MQYRAVSHVRSKCSHTDCALARTWQSFPHYLGSELVFPASTRKSMRRLRFTGPMMAAVPRREPCKHVLL